MVFDRLDQLKYHVKCTRSVSCFLKKVEFFGYTVSAAGVGII